MGFYTALASTSGEFFIFLPSSNHVFPSPHLMTVPSNLPHIDVERLPEF